MGPTQSQACCIGTHSNQELKGCLNAGPKRCMPVQKHMIDPTMEGKLTLALWSVSPESSPLPDPARSYNSWVG